MNGDTSRQPLLVEFYEAFLNEHDEDAFIAAVAQRYLPATLQRIARCGDRASRRSAVLALGYLGDYESNGVLGKALVDRDRGVRTLAETAIRNVWCRAGTTEQRRILEAIVRHNQSHEHERAIDLATRLVHESPWIAEAWCQRGTAYFHQRQYEAAIGDCRQALEINPYHFLAAAGIGQCFLRQRNPAAALEAFRRALRLNPSMEEVRAKVIQLQRSLKEEGP